MAEFEPRLTTDIWVSALIRRAEGAGAFAAVLHKGDPTGGAVLVKVVNRRAGETRLYASAIRGGGERVWMRPTPALEEREVDDYAARQRRYDPDLWVVEIEDAHGRHHLTEPVEDG